jgi:hypothetical protein
MSFYPKQCYLVCCWDCSEQMYIKTFDNLSEAWYENLYDYEYSTFVIVDVKNKVTLSIEEVVKQLSAADE